MSAAKTRTDQVPPPLTAYTVDLELEVDRLRRAGHYLQQQTAERVDKILELCRREPAAVAALTEIAEISSSLRGLLNDLQDPPEFQPVFDRVATIAVARLARQAFRWQQHLSGTGHAELRVEVAVERIMWFPARLRHILDNVFSNALRYHDAEKGEIRVSMELLARREAYELRVTDNGLGMSNEEIQGAMDLSHRAAPGRAAHLGVGLAVVKFLVEQCCGTLSLTSGKGLGTCVSVVLPRFDEGDHVE